MIDTIFHYSKSILELFVTLYVHDNTANKSSEANFERGDLSEIHIFKWVSDNKATKADLKSPESKNHDQICSSPVTEIMHNLVYLFFAALKQFFFIYVSMLWQILQLGTIFNSLLTFQELFNIFILSFLF